MRKLTVAIIGSWGHSVDILSELEGMEHVRVSALAKVLPDDDFAAWQNRFTKVSSTEVHPDYQELLHCERPDVAVIGTRLDKISTVATHAARAGCHLICEKPLASSVETLRAFRSEVKSRRVACISMLANADQPAFRAARAAVFDGAIGAITQVYVRKTYKWGIRPTWFGDPDIYPGTIPWIGAHGFDILTYATGLAPLKVAAQQGNIAHPSHPACQDRAEILVELARGAGAVISIDYLRPEAAPTHGDDYIRISGSCGEIEAYADRGDGGICQLADGQGARALALPPRGHVYGDFFRDIAAGKTGELMAQTRAAFDRTYWSLCAHQAAQSQTSQPISNFDD